MKRWWLSFVDDSCEPHRFLGVAIVRAHDGIGAIRVAHALGCNPGGQVAIGVFPDGYEGPENDLPEGKLLSRADLEGAKVGWVTTGEILRELENPSKPLKK